MTIMLKFLCQCQLLDQDHFHTSGKKMELILMIKTTLELMKQLSLSDPFHSNMKGTTRVK